MGHEDADAIASRLGRLDGRVDLVLIRDVACEQQRLSLGGQVAHLIGMTCGHNRMIAALKHMLGEFFEKGRPDIERQPVEVGPYVRRWRRRAGRWRPIRNTSPDSPWVTFPHST